MELLKILKDVEILSVNGDTGRRIRRSGRALREGPRS